MDRDDKNEGPDDHLIRAAVAICFYYPINARKEGYAEV